MAIVCEPLKDKVLLTQRIAECTPKKVLLIFWHGVGDLVMFLAPYRALCAAFPTIHFDIGVPGGMTYLDIVPNDAIEVTGDQVNDKAHELPYDLVAKITFPMNEYDKTEHTKGEYCCLFELGIELTSGHDFAAPYPTPLVCVHFNITCLPDCANPDRNTAEKIWNDVLAEGFVPLECHYQHVFHSPVNVKFDFVDATVRRCRPELKSLIGLLLHARAFVGVVSGPFHLALALLGAERVLLLEKDFKATHFTKRKIATADLRNYQNEVRAFLKGLPM